MKLRATVYPNNEVRVALYPEKMPVDYFKEISPCPVPTQDNNESGSNGIDSTSSNATVKTGARTLDIKSKKDTPTRIPRWALSRRGRNQILRAGACFEKGLDTERLLLTGTLPGSTVAAFRVLAQNSTVITKRLTNWITRRVPKCSWIYVWEFQGRGALHLHLVLECRPEAAAYFKAHFKDEWNKLLRDVSSESKTDLFAKTSHYSHSPRKTQADVTVCDREPSRYISKYLSKKATNSKGFSRFPPKTWYRISRNLLRRLKTMTVVYEAEGLSYSQSRAVEENTRTYVEQHKISGIRRFDGSIYAWSAYLYCDDPKLSEIYEGFGMREQQLLSAIAVARIARATMKQYAASSCFVRAATNATTLERMESGLITDTELLAYIDAVVKTLSVRLSKEFCPWNSAHFLKTADSWYRAKFGYSKLSPKSLEEVNKIHNDGLTSGTSRTRVDKQQLRLNIG